MEPIILCGLVIVLFGLWVEFEPAVKAVIKAINTCTVFADFVSHSRVQKPVYASRMPLCLAKAFRC